MNNRKNLLQKSLGIGLIATMIFSQSCKKSFLDINPANGQKAQTFYKTEADANAAVTAMYSSLRSYASIAFPAIAIESMGSGDVDKGSVPSDASFMNDFIKFNVTSGEGQVPEFWDGEYVIINYANQNLDNIPAINMDAGLKARYIAESKFVRAWAYFRLVRAYGDVPLRLHVPKDPSEYNIARNPKAEVYAAIERDLADAAAVLPQSYSAADIGRITKGAALALHAKVAMYQNKWPDVLTYTNSVIGSGTYSLFPDYEQMFRTNHKNNSESIFEVQCPYIPNNPDACTSQYSEVQAARVPAGGGWGFNVPNAALAAVFEPGDPRKDATFLYEGETTPEGETLPTGLDNPAYNQKAYVPFRINAARPGFHSGCDQDYIAIRYADVLLMNAEANNNLGNTTAALASLELVRARARGTNSGILPKITITDKTQLQTAIWHERHVELALEFDHYFDVIRRGSSYATAEFGGRGWKAGKNEVWPIPQAEIDLSAGKLTQNPGY